MRFSVTIPPALKKGDVLGIIAPAGQIADPDRFDQGIRLLIEMGFEPRFPRQMWPGHGYLADSDANRVNELHKMLVDPEIKGIMAARGGYGCLRLLGRMDFQLFRGNPKVFIGFSDLTILLNQIVHQTGLVCFHGPVVTSLCDCTISALECFHHSVCGRWRGAIKPKSVEILREGDAATGKLIGGNLSTLVSTLGTPFDFNWENSILVLEDVGEPLYRIDRMLTQLSISGKFHGLSGIVLGDFTLNADQDQVEKSRYAEYIWKRILELTSGMDMPVLGNFPTGHCAENLTLPIGANALIDCGSGALRFS